MAEILHVGDSVLVSDCGRVTVERIDVCLQPSTDPAGEEHAVSVEAVEIGEHGPPIVVAFGDHWAYGIKVVASTIEPGDR